MLYRTQYLAYRRHRFLIDAREPQWGYYRGNTPVIRGKTALKGKILWNYRGNHGDGDSFYGNTAVTGTLRAGIPR